MSSLLATFHTPFAIVGALFISLTVFKLLAFIWRHFLRPSNNLKRYGADKSKDGDSWAVVTGGSKGIGKQFVKELLKRGMNVIVVARTADSSVESEVKKSSTLRQVVCAKADLGNVESIEASLRPILAGKKVTLLVNNAGISLDHPDYFLEQPSISRVNSIIDLNIRAVNEVTRLILPAMVEQKCGGIVNVGSISCYAPSMLAVYGASKAYVSAFSEGLASEYKSKGVDVICITPGMVVSEMSKVRKPRLDCPLPPVVVSRALDALGGSDVVVSPYWFHDVQEFVLRILPHRSPPTVAFQTAIPLRFFQFHDELHIEAAPEREEARAAEKDAVIGAQRHPGAARRAHSRSFVRRKPGQRGGVMRCRKNRRGCSVARVDV